MEPVLGCALPVQDARHLAGSAAAGIGVGRGAHGAEEELTADIDFLKYSRFFFSNILLLFHSLSSSPIEITSVFTGLNLRGSRTPPHPPQPPSGPVELEGDPKCP